MAHHPACPLQCWKLTCALLAQLSNDGLQQHKAQVVWYIESESSCRHQCDQHRTVPTCAMTTEVMAAHLHAMAYCTTCAPGVWPPQDRMQPYPKTHGMNTHSATLQRHRMM